MKAASSTGGNGIGAAIKYTRFIRAGMPALSGCLFGDSSLLPPAVEKRRRPAPNATPKDDGSATSTNRRRSATTNRAMRRSPVPLLRCAPAARRSAPSVKPEINTAAGPAARPPEPAVMHVEMAAGQASWPPCGVCSAAQRMRLELLQNYDSASRGLAADPAPADSPRRRRRPRPRYLHRAAITIARLRRLELGRPPPAWPR